VTRAYGPRVGLPSSVHFDRAASYYDETRALSPDATRAVSALLTCELRGRGRVLEIGVGTGRIALPLILAGIPIIGADLSRPMLERLAVNAEGMGIKPPPVVVADATELPLHNGGVAAAIACHVLHLIPRWQEALEELLRVTEPGGTLLVELGEDVTPKDDPRRAIEDRLWKEATGGGRPPRLGIRSRQQLDAYLTNHGARMRALDPVTDTKETSLDETIDAFQHGYYSQTWGLSDALRERAAGVVREWAQSLFGPLGRPVTRVRRLAWRAYDL
jgi:ubiquinone/menaquinone biosynthesis C-methylase UbiE